MNDIEDHHHIGEGDLVRYLDGEATPAERAEIARQLLACQECAAELDSLRQLRQQFAELIGGAPVADMDVGRRARSRAIVEQAAARRTAAPRRAPGRPALRAAAVAAVAVAGAFSLSPVRAAVLDFWRGITTEVDQRFAGAPAVATPPVSHPLNGATIGFIPGAEVFRLEIANRQPAGSLALGLNEGASLTANAVGGSGDINLVVLPDGMRIENPADATATYAVGLPAQIRELRIRIEDEPEIVFRREQLAESWISLVELGPVQ